METNRSNTFRRIAGHETPTGPVKTAQDPVCGAFLAYGALRFIYDGHSFPFCGFPCLSRFRANPADFLQETAEVTNAFCKKPPRSRTRQRDRNGEKAWKHHKGTWS
jgi:YHS domain-containing protein